jgi:hypothetical protein
MGKQSNRRKSNRIQRTATSIATNGMTVSRLAGITMEQAVLAAALMMALTVNDVNAAKKLAMQIELAGASIFDFEFNMFRCGGSAKSGLVETAWFHSQEQSILWIAQKALDDGVWETTPLLKTLPALLEIFTDDWPSHHLAEKAVRLMADMLTKQIITELRSDGIVNFDGVERFWDHVPPKTQVIFQECFAAHLSKMEKSQLVAATATPAATVNGPCSTSNRL